MHKTMWFAALACGMTACGTFNLGNVRPQAGKTAEQQQLDTLTCKDQASLAVNSTPSSRRSCGSKVLQFPTVASCAWFQRN